MNRTMINGLILSLSTSLLVACGGTTASSSSSGSKMLATTTACFAPWNSTTAYTAGQTASYAGVNYTAAFWSQGQNPSTSNGPAGGGQPWISNGACGSVSTPTPTPTPAPAPTLSEPSSINAGSNLTVSYSVPSNQLSTKNWIGVYPAGVTPGSGSQSSAWTYAPNASGSLTVNTSGLAAGSYAVWYLYNDGYTVLKGPQSLTIGAVPTMMVPTAINVGSTLSVSYSVPSGKVSSKNWVGVYPSGVTPGSGSQSSAWAYAPNGSGSVTINTSGLAAGSYAVWYLYNDGYTVLSGPRSLSISSGTIDTRRPIYVIAHRVDTLDGVSAALKHGANAIEVDLCAWSAPDEWRAWHDCSSAGNNRLGPSIDSMIDRILSEADAGRKLTMVWIDFKDPNYCSPTTNRACSVLGLQDKMQRLISAGIQVLYGFYEYHGGSNSDVGGQGWTSLQNRLGPLEGITTTGSFSTVRNAYANFGSGFALGHRVMDDGNSDISNGFGNCTTIGGYCTELKSAGQSRDAGNFAATLSWTTTYVDETYVDRLLGAAGVDGIIAGYGGSTGVRDYDDNPLTANAIALILNWVANHSSTHRLANNSDRMFR